MFRLIAIVIACASTSIPAIAAEPATRPVQANTFESGWYDPALVEKVRAQRERLRAAAATQPAHPIAGQYYQGDGLGMNLTLTVGPSMEYTLTWTGCMGLYHLDHGTVTFEGSAVELQPQLKQREDHTMRVPTKLARVPWGKRTYLLAEHDIDHFMKAVERKSEPRDDMHGIGYLKLGDEKLPAEGKPQIKPTRD